MRGEGGRWVSSELELARELASAWAIAAVLSFSWLPERRLRVREGGGTGHDSR